MSDARTRGERIRLMQLMQERLVRESRSDLLRFTFSTMPNFRPADFHRRYYKVLTDFADGEIKKLMVFMPPQHGKALQVDTPVLTTEGWKRHGDLRVGDFVFGEDGKPKKVEWTSGNYSWHTMSVDFADGFSMIAAHEHEWELWCDRDKRPKGRRKERLETQEIFAKKHRRNPYTMANAVLELPERSLPIDPYLLGVWLGNGNARDKWVSCGREDIEHYRQYAVEVKGDHHCYKAHLKGLETSDLRSIGVLMNKHIPKDYLLASAAQRRALMQGLMDTDGCVNERGMCEFTQKMNQLAEDAYILFRSLGYKPTRHIYDAMLDGKNVGKKTRICFVPCKGDNVFRLSRKQGRLNGKNTADREDKMKFFVTGTRENGVEMVNCIQVEDGMYLAGHELVPTHNSEGSTRRLPTFLAGRNPDAKIAVISYSATKAKKFNREMQRIIDSPEYHEIFPDTTLAQSVFGEDNGSGYVRTTEEFEFVGHSGSIKTVGVGGSLTGDPVDYLIMDDIYKDAKTAWSPVVRESVSDWYDTVAETRLHNGSQQLIVFTRWHEEDLAGRLLKEQGTYDPVTNPNGWVVVVFKAIKEGAPTGYDPREEGAALWPEKHSLEKLLATRKRNPHVFESLYQQNPKPAEGLMYDSGFAEYEVRPASSRVKRKAYVDTADTGSDYLCAIIYDETETANYIVDVLYTQKPMEYTEPELARMLTKHQVANCIVESNNGGRGFQRAVEKQCRLMGNVKTKFTWFTQTANKNVRIFSNSAAVQNLCIMPKGWRLLFPDFHNALSGYLKVGSNEHDDAPDALTGTVEKRQSSGGCDVGSLFGY